MDEVIRNLAPPVGLLLLAFGGLIYARWTAKRSAHTRRRRDAHVGAVRAAE
jgi:hypothetical protein